ncbi:hypothetical protein B0H19DRAFT_1260247 [Mycena capillaripes]|nr:hypothetical protein B0H19DRAFT_1260247 [Mycena capillaripes]
MVSLLRLHGLSIVLHGLLTVLAGPSIVSSLWRKPSVTLPSAERIHLASAALEQSVSLAHTISEYRATVDYEMAEFDIATQQSTYATQLQEYLLGGIKDELGAADLPVRASSHIHTLFLKCIGPSLNLHNLLSLGHAAIRAYTAYKQQVFLDLANQTWVYVRSYTISADDIAAGSLPGKDFSVVTDCQGAAMLGGTFDSNNATEPTISSYASTYFLALSAFLAEATSFPMYLNAALDSLNFLSAHLTTKSLIQNGISANQDTPCVLDGTTNSFSTGLMMQGLAVLSSIRTNASTQALLDNMIEATMSNAEWQTSNGIIAQGTQKQGDKFLIRGLAAAYTKNTTSPDLRPYLHDYIGVQFNAVIDLATSGGSDIYAGTWTGPPSAVFDQSNQTTAISALLAGISLNDPDPTSTSPASPSSTASVLPTSTGRGVPAAAIAGAVVDGVVLLVMVILGVWFLMRRRTHAGRPLSSTTTIAPFPIFTPGTQPELPRSWRLDLKSAVKSPVSLPLSPASDNTPNSLAQGAADEPSGSAPAASPILLPLSDLVRMLTERLGDRMPARQWDEEEQPPPEYGTGQRQQ